jgi:hypothetical protein
MVRGLARSNSYCFKLGKRELLTRSGSTVDYAETTCPCGFFSRLAPAWLDVAALPKGHRCLSVIVSALGSVFEFLLVTAAESNSMSDHQEVWLRALNALV